MELATANDRTVELPLYRLVLAHAELIRIISSALQNVPSDQSMGSSDLWQKRVLPLLEKRVQPLRKAVVYTLQGDHLPALNLSETYVSLSRDLIDNFFFDMQWMPVESQQRLQETVHEIVESAEQTRDAALNAVKP